VSDPIYRHICRDRQVVHSRHSILSYAGTVDSRTGSSWGGVVNSRGHAQIEYGRGAASFYLGGGYDVLTGQNVASNNEWEFGAGGNFVAYQAADAQARVGLDIVAFGYDKNLRFFTYGQGGYFSPQNYFAALVPVSYKETDDAWEWSLGGAAGYQTYHESASDVFPTDPALQNGVAAFAAVDTVVRSVYPARSQSGLVGNGHADVRYQIDTGLEVDGHLAYQRSGDWNEATVTLAAKYRFGINN
jgi:cellulose synthase operon protein C